MSLGRPLQSNKKRERVSFTLHPDEKVWLEEKAQAMNLNRSEFLSLLLNRIQEKNLGSTAKNHLEQNLSFSRHALVQICEKYHVQSLALFGSILGPKYHANSDVDVLVKFKTNHSPSLFQMAKIQDELEALFSVSTVDLRTQEEISKIFVKQLKSKEIYAA